MEPDFEALAHEAARSMAGMRQVLEPVDEAALGYRKQLEASGWSAESAERMAAEFYVFQMKSLGSGLGAA